MQVIRRFPPQQIFTTLRERRARGHDVCLCLQMALRDPAVWGTDADDFVLRPLREYHALSVAFAEPAVSPQLASGNSHACPGRDLTFAVAKAFLGEFVRSADAESGGLAAAWAPCRADAFGKLSPCSPRDIVLSEAGAPTFVLGREPRAQPRVAPRSGASVLEALEPADRLLVQSHARVANALDTAVDAYTYFWASVPRLVAGGQPQAKDVTADLRPKRDAAADGLLAVAPACGVLYATDDEEEPPTVTAALFRALSFASSAGLTFSERGADALVYFETPAAAAAAVDATFARYFPPQLAQPWDEMGTDTGAAAVCTHGIGQLHLARASAPDIPFGARLVVDLRDLAKYEVRPPWQPYGHAAYLSEMSPAGTAQLVAIAPPGAGPGQALRPGEPGWEEARAGFLASLLVTTAVKLHLVDNLLIRANALSRACRETLGPQHPVRRLLRPHAYGAARAVKAAVQTHLVENSLAERTFGFSRAGWAQLVTDSVRTFTWEPFPARLRRLGAAADGLPLAVDGQALHRTMRAHVVAYAGIFYPRGNKDVKADPELADFHKFFVSTMGWKLPPFSLDSVVDLVTDLMWWSSAGREVVGSLAEYVMHPMGMAAKLAPGKTLADVQTVALTLSLVSLNARQQPRLCDDWTHVYGQAHSWPARRRTQAVAEARAFQAALEGLASDVDEANERRRRAGARAFLACNPRVLRSSVAG